MEKPVFIDTVPEPVLIEIFLFCYCDDFFCLLPYICKKWQLILSQNPILWKGICINHLHIYDNYLQVPKIYKRRALNRYKALKIYRDILELKTPVSRVLKQCLLPMNRVPSIFEPCLKIWLGKTKIEPNNVSKYLHSISPDSINLPSLKEKNILNQFFYVILSADVELKIMYPLFAAASVIMEGIKKTLDLYSTLKVININPLNDIEKLRADE